MVGKPNDIKKKPTKKERDERIAAHLPSVLHYHNTMLTDKVRNKPLKKAISKALKPGMSFLDIGAGTGVWAILAAKLGAARVVAIETEESLIPIIGRVAQENGVADRIEIIHGRSNDVRLSGRFDVIASEIFDSNAFGKETVASFVDIRKRFLAKGGVLIPERFELMAAPIIYRGGASAEAAGIGIKTSFLRDLTLNYSDAISFPASSSLKFLADPIPIISIDFASVDETYTALGEGTWQLRELSKADGIATFPRSTFLGDITMTALESQSWSTGYYPFEKLGKGSGKLKFSLSTDSNSWSVETTDSHGRRMQNYSPVFAFTRLKMAQKMTPHRRFSRRK